MAARHPGHVPAYKVWPGNNRFCCSGRLMTGPSEDWPSNLCAWGSIIIISGCYFIFAAPYIWRTMSPALPLLSAALLAVTIGFFLITSFSDPGIIPRKSWIRLVRADSEEEIKEDPVADEHAHSVGKYCETCQITRPARASHCSVCDNCVLVFDHHCPFVNNCIGQRNYPFFLGFLLSVTLLAIVVMIGFVVIMRKSTGDEGMSTTMIIVMGVLLGLPTAALAVTLVVFCGWHIVVICSGRTTRERLKGLSSGGGPSEGGCPCNWFSGVTTARPPSQLRLQAYVPVNRIDPVFNTSVMPNTSSSSSSSAALSSSGLSSSGLSSSSADNV